MPRQYLRDLEQLQAPRLWIAHELRPLAGRRPRLGRCGPARAASIGWRATTSSLLQISDGRSAEVPGLPPILTQTSVRGRAAQTRLSTTKMGGPNMNNGAIDRSHVLTRRSALWLVGAALIVPKTSAFAQTSNILVTRIRIVGAVQVGYNILRLQAWSSRSKRLLTFKSSGNGLEYRPISRRATLPRSTDMSWKDTYRQLPYGGFWIDDRPPLD
jgi:hypothetical protein